MRNAMVRWLIPHPGQRFWQFCLPYVILYSAVGVMIESLVGFRWYAALAPSICMAICSAAAVYFGLVGGTETPDKSSPPRDK